jgi:hypothetical protein
MKHCKYNGLVGVFLCIAYMSHERCDISVSTSNGVLKEEQNKKITRRKYSKY